MNVQNVPFALFAVFARPVTLVQVLPVFAGDRFRPRNGRDIRIDNFNRAIHGQNKTTAFDRFGPDDSLLGNH